jgi:hypothetical protein
MCPLSAIQRQTKRSRFPYFRWAVAGILLLLVFCAVWIGIRAFLARDELLGAVPVANKIGDTALTEGGDIAADLGELRARADTAESLTSDVIWRAAEWVPGLGVNLAAFRESAAVISNLAEEALPPISELAGTFTTDSLSPKGGVIDLQVFVDAKPMLGEARAALEDADIAAGDIETERTIPQIGSAVDQVIDLVSRAKGVVDGLDTAASLLPPMLGADEPREYLLLSLNNAELRATGGLPGAIAVIHADQGRLSLGELSTATAVGRFAEPVVALTDAENTLYGEALGTWMHDVTYTPDFPRSGQLAQAMWLDRTGMSVDGVISIDPIALGHILGATGPVKSTSGITVSSTNAADVLLSQVYSRFGKQSEQDAFFGELTGRVFEALTAGKAEGVSLINALVRGADENRIHVWSSNESEQDQLADTAISGIVPLSTEEDTAFGVYFNDATGAKMDYYLNSSIAIASATCRNDQRPNFEVRTSLTSSAPADAASALTSYVTGGGVYGVTPGNIRTNVFVYAPDGSVPYSVTIDGQEYSFVAADDGKHSIAGVTVELAPGQTSTVAMKFVGEVTSAEAVALQHTPLASEVQTSLDNYLDCDGIAPPPIDEDDEESSAASLRPNEAFIG